MKEPCCDGNQLSTFCASHLTPPNATPPIMAGIEALGEALGNQEHKVGIHAISLMDF